MGRIDRLLQAASGIFITNKDEDKVVDVKTDLGKNKLYVTSDLAGDLAFTSTYRIIESETNVSLAPNTWTPIYSGTGFSLVGQFICQFDSSRVRVRLTIDGTQVYDIYMLVLNTYVNWNNSPNPRTVVSWNSSGNIFYFIPMFPMRADSSFVIEAMSTQGNRNLHGFYLETL